MRPAPAVIVVPRWLAVALTVLVLAVLTLSVVTNLRNVATTDDLCQFTKRSRINQIATAEDSARALIAAAQRSASDRGAGEAEMERIRVRGEAFADDVRSRIVRRLPEPRC